MSFQVITFCFVFITSIALCQEDKSLGERYGDEISEKGAVPAKKLPKKLDKDETVDITIKGEITEVCQAKGCWMTINMGNDEQLRVKFKDYAFFVPKDVAGKTAIIHGIATKEVISVDEQRHLAKDAGKSENDINAITNPNEEYTFVANGVIIQ